MTQHGSLNHIFRLIWNPALGAWIAVAENARGRGKSASRQLLAATLALTSISALAGPIGGVVTSGSGTIAQSTNSTTITQTTPKLALNWASFNVAAQETVNFVQPSSSAIAINRIADTNGSQILGHINANGQVFLINPNGVLFGANATVNVGGLVASTLAVSDANVTSSTVTLGGASTASVSNAGAINAPNGYVALVGANVSNTGTINARLGSVMLGAGSAATLTFDTNNILHMQVDQSVLNGLVANSGMIQADGGTVMLSVGAKNTLLASTVNNTGTIQARTVSDQGGVITLSGGILAGNVNVNGTLDVSAPTSGNGGAITTTAANVLIADSAIVTSAAASGSAGNWLIDRVGFRVAASDGSMSGAALTSALAKGNVSIVDRPNASGTVVGNINIVDAVTWSANQLSLNANSNINFNAVMNGSGTASLVLAFGQTMTTLNNPYSYIAYAPVNLPTGQSLTTIRGTDGTRKNFTVINSLGAAGSMSTTDLQGMSGNLNTNYALGSNIDATATAGWNNGAGFMPIGNNTTPFKDKFEGLGHTISNLSIFRPGTDGVGLFGSLAGGYVLADVGLTNATIVGNNVVGGLVGANAGTITNSYVTGNIIGKGGAVGGIAGVNTGAINTSYTTSNAIGSGDNVGGIAGVNGGTVTTSYATGTTIGSGDSTGGLIGLNNGTVANTYATGTVIGSGANVGGLLGLNNRTLLNAYASGRVIGSSAGGLVGLTSTTGTTGTVSNSYWNTDLGQATSSGGTGLSSAQMTQMASFSSWNTTNNVIANTGGANATWRIYEGHTAPLLEHFLTPVTLQATNGTYNGLSQTGATSTLAGLQGSAAIGTNAGTYNNTYYSNQNGYDIAGGNLVITPKVLTVAGLTGTNRTYNGTTTDALTGSAVLSGLVTGQTLTLGNTTVGTLAAANAGSEAVTTAVTLANGTGGGLTSNYVLTQSTLGNVTIAQAPLTVSGLTSTGRNYNGSTSDALSGNAALVGLVSGQTLTLGNATVGTLTSANAGSEAVTTAITMANGIGGDLASNYALMQPTLANVTIARAPLTVSGLTGTGRTYNGSTSDTLSGNAVLGGLVPGQTLTLGNATVGTLTSANAGIETVTTAMTIANGTGGLISNYVLTQPTLGNVTISQAPLTVSGLTGTGRIYNGNTSDTLTGSAVLAGLVTGQTLTLGNTTVGTLTSANAGSEAVTTAVTIANGTGGGLASNYALTQATLANVTIAKAPLTISGLTGTGRKYDGSTSDTLGGSAVLTGLIGNQTLTLGNATVGTLTSANAGSEAVTTAITIANGIGGDLASNYALTQPTLANVTIARAPLTVSGLTGTGRSYNGSTSDTLTGSAVLVGLISGQTLTLGNATVGTLTSANAGSEAVTTAVTIANGTGGGLVSNYALTQPTLANVTIDRAPLTVSGLVGTSRAANGSTSDALSGTATLSGLVTGQTLTLGNTTVGTLASASAGSEPVTTAVTIADGTGLASNYRLTQPTLSNVTISAAPAPAPTSAAPVATTTKSQTTKPS